MEYTRGDVEVLVSNRTRNIIDHNGSVIIPALSNGIRVFPDNSFIDDSTTKFYQQPNFMDYPHTFIPCLHTVYEIIGFDSV